MFVSTGRVFVIQLQDSLSQAIEQTISHHNQLMQTLVCILMNPVIRINSSRY